MIVITKNMLYSVFVLFLAGIFTAFSVVFVSRNKNMQAFADYKPILESEITGIGGTKQDKNEKKAELSRVYKGIIKYFFFLEEQGDDVNYINDEEGLSGEMITSEVRKVTKGMEISNATDFQVNPNDYINQKLTFSLDSQGPQILIIHTHTTESYSAESYKRDAPDRDLDEAKNIVAVGKIIAETFEKNGISVYHDKTVHDYPSYNGAYQRAATTIRNDLEAYHGIKVVLDIHRDGITKEDGTKVKLLTNINGKDTAQVMLVVGTNTNLQHDNWKENFKFASKIQAKAQEMYPTLMRQINLRKERFNEQMTAGSLIIEVGTNGNTLAEAIEGGRDIAQVISAVLKD
ncbi:MAG: stage II sporulation protein P [Firmicutes bacterium]|nr:stage II sporulation protein P [Bacillota bacterium]